MRYRHMIPRTAHCSKGCRQRIMRRVRGKYVGIGMDTGNHGSRRGYVLDGDDYDMDATRLEGLGADNAGWT